MSANVSAIRSTSPVRLAVRIALVVAVLGLIALAAMRWSQLSDWVASNWTAGQTKLSNSSKPGAAGQKTAANGDAHKHGAAGHDEGEHAGHDHAAHGGGEDAIE